ncbi:MAG: LPS export ABC transporter periplasmic protein LptC [Campylobacterota bacterium]|nr:LPS export ABC transporter periplasmic protein LptC [Campylobacterota bacterium]
MNVNYFFSILTLGLIAVFMLFRPMVIEKQEKKEIALLDLKKFTVYELKQSGLQSVMKGSSGERYDNRYEVYDANFTDNSHAYLQNMVSDFARYQGEKVYLERNVHYARADGLSFMSDEAFYNQKKGVAKTKGPFTVVQNQDKIDGTALYYNSKKGIVKAKKVTGYYTLKTKKDNH